MAAQSTGAEAYSVVAFATCVRSSAIAIGETPVWLLAEVAHQHPGIAFVCGIGDPRARRTVAEQATRLGLEPVTLVHRDALVAPDALLSPGVVVFGRAVISVACRLGEHAHVNFGATVSHDSVLGAFATISPGANLAGNVQVGAEVLIGIGASVLNGRPGTPIRIGDRAVVGASACVVGDVPADAVVAGVPARPFQRQQPS